MPSQVIKVFDVFDYGQLYHKTTEDTPPTEFIGGWYARKHVSILASKSGVGKTWYIIKLIADLSKGGTIFLEQAYYEPPRKILYFVGETNIALVNERFAKLRDSRNPDNITLVSYIEAAKMGCNLDLDDFRENDDCGFRNIKNIIGQVAPDLVIFDTMMSFRADDENSAQATRNMIIRLQKLADNFNVAVLATHHLRKSDKKERKQNIDQDEIIGSSALVRLAGSAFIMTKNYSAIKISCVKSWWEVPPTLLYKMKKLDNEQITFELADLSEDITEARLRAERYIIEQFKYGGQLTVKGVADACNVSIPTATVALQNKAKVISQISNGGRPTQTFGPK